VLDVLADPQGFYRRSGPKLKRALNKVIFDRLYVDEGRIEAHRLAPVVSELVQANYPTATYERRSEALVASQAVARNTTALSAWTGLVGGRHRAPEPRLLGAMDGVRTFWWS
jgi:hypothetical protein